MSQSPNKEEYGIQTAGTVLEFDPLKGKSGKEAMDVPHLKAEKTPRLVRKFAHTVGRRLGSVSTAVCRAGLTFFEGEID